jgi:hypothetical protein
VSVQKVSRAHSAKSHYHHSVHQTHVLMLVIVHRQPMVEAYVNAEMDIRERFVENTQRQASALQIHASMVVLVSILTPQMVLASVIYYSLVDSVKHKVRLVSAH